MSVRKCSVGLVFVDSWDDDKETVSVFLIVHF